MAQDERPSDTPQANEQPGVAASSRTWPSALAPQTADVQEAPQTAPSSAPGFGSAAGLTALASSSESSKISGCLARPPSDQAPTRSASAGGKGGETWRATALGNGVLVTHTFEHACCLTGTAAASVTSTTITVEERLTGQPCRCVCESTIQTRVPAPAGEYDVQTVTVTNGRRRLAQAVRVTVGVKPHE